MSAALSVAVTPALIDDITNRVMKLVAGEGYDSDEWAAVRSEVAAAFAAISVPKRARVYDPTAAWFSKPNQNS